MVSPAPHPGHTSISTGSEVMPKAVQTAQSHLKHVLNPGPLWRPMRLLGCWGHKLLLVLFAHGRNAWAVTIFPNHQSFLSIFWEAQQWSSTWEWLRFVFFLIAGHCFSPQEIDTKLIQIEKINHGWFVYQSSINHPSTSPWSINDPLHRLITYENIWNIDIL